MVMVRRLIGAYAGEVAEMEYPVAINAQRNGAVEIVNDASVTLAGTHPGLANSQLVNPLQAEAPQASIADIPYEPAPRPVIIGDDGTERGSIDPQDDASDAPSAGPAPLPRVPLAGRSAARAAAR